MSVARNKKRAAIVTGGARRVGQELALALAKSGFDILLHYNNSHSDAESTKKIIKSLGQNCATHRADLRNPETCQPLIDAAFEEFPYCSLLINNASIFHRMTRSETTWEYLEENFLLHVISPFALSQHFIAKQPKSGTIINMVDSMVEQKSSAFFPYLLSKRALLDMTNAMQNHTVPTYPILPKLLMQNPENIKPGTEVEIAAVIDQVLALANQSS